MFLRRRYILEQYLVTHTVAIGEKIICRKSGYHPLLDPAFVHILRVADVVTVTTLILDIDIKLISYSGDVVPECTLW